MKTLRCTVSPLLLALIIANACFGEEAKLASPQKRTSPAAEAKLSWLDRIDKIHEPGYMDWITVAWATMLVKQGIISAEDAPKAARVVLQLWEFDFAEDERAWGQFYKNHYFFVKRLDKELAGMMMIVRTQPSARQMLEVRHQLMKQMCRIYDLQEATLDLAEQHTTTIMPGYTHFRHAQPTTFGHYLLSVSDAVGRSTKTLERGYHLMSLNEMGCGALAGTSWPIDRDLVSRYLGMEGLIENANDAVSYTDGYLVVVCGLANVTNIASRTALELSYWSGVEYGFLDIGHHRGHSFMMPQKDGNPNGMEIIRMRAGQMIGHLTGVAVAGLRAPHGDVFEMLYVAEPTLAALEAAEKCTLELSREMRKMQVHKERMLAVIRESYICATELANQMVRDYELGYRTAHDIVNEFVLASREQKIPAIKARAELLDEAAQKVLGRKLGMAEARLRELLDPAYFIKVTNSRGGVAPDEVARMIADRRQKLADARARHLMRIESLENAQKKMLSDLCGLYEKSERTSKATRTPADHP
jgi:argininosuccinate lyase